MTSGFVTKKIGKKKRSLGSILKAARTKSGYTIEQAESETKVAAKYLIALESGSYSKMPAEAYNLGYVRSYAEFLKLNTEKIIQLYRLERSQYNLATKGPGAHIRPKRVGDWNFLVTPRLLGALAMVAGFVAISGYIAFQISKFAEPPSLEITNVPTDFTSNKDTVVLEGRTIGGAVVSMNTEPIFVTTDGKFSQDIQLSPGLNQILVQARNRADKESRLVVRVLYKPDIAQATADETSTN